MPPLPKSTPMQHKTKPHITTNSPDTFPPERIFQIPLQQLYSSHQRRRTIGQRDPSLQTCSIDSGSNPGNFEPVGLAVRKETVALFKGHWTRTHLGVSPGSPTPEEAADKDMLKKKHASSAPCSFEPS
jgi:hypothetical protein